MNSLFWICLWVISRLNQLQHKQESLWVQVSYDSKGTVWIPSEKLWVGDRPSPDLSSLRPTVMARQGMRSSVWAQRSAAEKEKAHGHHKLETEQKGFFQDMLFPPVDYSASCLECTTYGTGTMKVFEKWLPNSIVLC